MADRTGACRYWLIWAAAIPLAMWALIRAFGLESGGLLTTAMFFTPYTAIAALLVAGVAVALRNWAAAVVAAIAAMYLAVAVLPRAIGTATARAEGNETLTVLAANVYLGTADPPALVALVDRLHPDVLSIPELTPSFVRELRQAGIGRQLPHAVLMAQPKGRGGGLYSRFPLTPLPGQTHFLFRMPRAMLTLPGDQGPPWGGITIDHVLADDRLGVTNYGVEDLPGSDHRAIHARLALP